MLNVLFLTKMPEKGTLYFKNLPDTNVLFDSPDNLSADQLASVEAVLGNPSGELVTKLPNLKWIQLNSAGANTYGWLPEHILLTNASGAYGPAISEYMITYAFAGLKNLMKYHDLQKEESWTDLGKVPMFDRCTVVSLGMGDIGSNFLKRAKALGAYTVGVRRTAHDKPEYADELVTYSELEDILPRADILGMSLPETAETTGIMSRNRLSKMKKDSVLINVGRGSAIVTEDLENLVREGMFRAVFLDVTDPEPLPEGHPLWKEDRVYITPHITGKFNSETTFENIVDIFQTNLRHYLNHEPLEHVVNRTLGY
ncbi:MAG: D-2-hydroxyacid dehydrogenase [Erysipelotrichales bacterium]|nr:D-2-hydroxyacid dehydrogenase [Erysipelotrichales bacterium]